ncbi:isoprenyl transferase [Sediminibacillus dalangtanensis]|uniref:Isoprenyl transferase n=1 Tax=Sediminibacillus dalangtanensis TaxID=2729421 RepID=A0ABX7VSG6_9BACI|nr:isoprenyl transferase [Sediminibacillus dalangtanensis]QTM99443.1 isoprenyl transferase [Sediminibacillus dalangtanensis]
MPIKLPFIGKTKKYNQNEQITLNKNTMPKHVAIIMDGNGRWAKKRGMPRVAGHKEGMSNVKKIVSAASSYQLDALTLYAFSTENWRRPKAEVDYLMKLPMEFLNTYLPELVQKNVKVQTIGRFDGLPKHTRDAVQKAKEQTKDNTGLILNIALNYGSRNEIMEAMKCFLDDVQAGKKSVEDMNEESFSQYLHTKNLPDPDLLIRTSGEQRLSNFLLWQSAYTEFWFTDVLWPDFDEQLFDKALCDYQKRKRRYGGI